MINAVIISAVAIGCLTVALMPCEPFVIPDPSCGVADTFKSHKTELVNAGLATKESETGNPICQEQGSYG